MMEGTGGDGGRRVGGRGDYGEGMEGRAGGEGKEGGEVMGTESDWEGMVMGKRRCDWDG